MYRLVHLKARSEYSPFWTDNLDLRVKIKAARVLEITAAPPKGRKINEIKK